MLETERLVMRLIEEGDGVYLYPLINDADVAHNLINVPHPYPEHEYACWIRDVTCGAGRRDRLELVIILKETGLPIGCCSLTDINWKHRRAETGYWLGREYWGQGYMTEALCRLIRHGFEDLGLERIYAYCLTRNTASARVMRKAGMRYEGRARHAVKKGDEYLDVLLYGIVKRDVRP